MTKMLISPRQIRAAREFLLWTQENLADVANISSRTVIKAECEPWPGQSEYVSRDSLDKIKKAFEGKRIEFIGTSGIVLHEESTATAYSGPNAPNTFYSKLLSAAKNNGDDVLAIFDTAESLARSLGVVNLEKLDRLEEISRYVSVKCLLLKADQSKLTIPFFQLRAAPRIPFGYQSRVICGELHATIESVDGKQFSYYENPSLELAALGRTEFAEAWISAQQIKDKKR